MKIPALKNEQNRASSVFIIQPVNRFRTNVADIRFLQIVADTDSHYHNINLLENKTHNKNKTKEKDPFTKIKYVLIIVNNQNDCDHCISFNNHIVSATSL